MIRELLAAVDRCIKDCTWKDFALVKCCLCAAGVLLGLMMPFRKKWAVAWLASLAFVAAYVPLMGKFLPYLLGERIPIEEIYKK